MMKKATTGKANGFSLIEVEVAITLIFFAITGLGVLTVTGIKQLQALETAAPQKVFVPPDNSVAVTAIIYSPQHPHLDNYHVVITTVTQFTSSATFNAVLTSSASLVTP